jgi:hypothetical protein
MVGRESSCLASLVATKRKTGSSMSESGLCEPLEDVLRATPWVGLPDEELDELDRLVTALRDAVDGERRYRSAQSWLPKQVA